MIRWPSACCLGLLLLSLSGCSNGGGRGGIVNPPPPDMNPIRTVVLQGGTGLVAPTTDANGEPLFQYVLIPFSTTQTGTVEVSVNWTFDTNLLVMFITEGICTPDQFGVSLDDPTCPAGPSCPCEFSVVSTTMLPKPRILSVESASAGDRTLIVGNFGPREESISFTIVLIT